MQNLKKRESKPSDVVWFFLQHCDEHCSSTLPVTFLHPHIHPRVGLYSARAELFFRYRVSRCAESPLWGLLQSASCYTVNIATVNIFFFQLWILLLWICIDLTCSAPAAPTPLPRIPIIPSSNSSNRSEPGSFSQLLNSNTLGVMTALQDRWNILSAVVSFSK